MDNSAMKIPASLVILGFVWCGFAQEYPIRVQRPMTAGQQFHLVCEVRDSHRGTMTSGATTLQDIKQEMTVALDALVTVLEASEKGELVKASYAITNCTRVSGKTKKELFPIGTVVTGWLEGQEEQFTVQDKPVEKDTRRAFALVAGIGKEQLLSDDVIGTEKPRRVGESWSINLEPTVALLDKMKMGTGQQEVQGKATLEQIVVVDGLECLELTAKIYLKKVSPTLPPGLEIKSSFGTIRLAGKFPTDVAVGPLEEMIEISAEFTASGKVPANVTPPRFKGSSSVQRTAKINYLKKQ
jgi:hypothetical protein